MLDHDAFVNAADINGWTPLRGANNKGYQEISQLLVENGTKSQFTQNRLAAHNK